MTPRDDRTATMSAHLSQISRQMRARNVASETFFAREAVALAHLCAQMSERFERGGRLLAFGRGCWASDAQHVAVEFLHPVLVGKRALPALDLSASFSQSIPAIVRAEDIVIGFGPPTGDAEVEVAMHAAKAHGALCVAITGSTADYVIGARSDDPFIHQEIVETLYHTLWETVHVFFERRALGDDGGAAGFLYPFLADPQPATAIIEEVAASIRAKAAAVGTLRDRIEMTQSEQMLAAATAIRDRVARGAAVLCFGNGGSATDATDLASDLVASPKGYASVPAISLAAEPATLTAIANDIGPEAIFVRQLIAHGRPNDVAVAISTSGGSANITAGLNEARARGLLTAALLGYDGGDVVRRGLADFPIVVASDQIPRIQEAQASIYHILLDLLHALRHAP